MTISDKQLKGPTVVNCNTEKTTRLLRELFKTHNRSNYKKTKTLCHWSFFSLSATEIKQSKDHIVPFYTKASPYPSKLSV